MSNVIEVNDLNSVLIPSTNGMDPDEAAGRMARMYAEAEFARRDAIVENAELREIIQLLKDQALLTALAHANEINELLKG